MPFDVFSLHPKTFIMADTTQCIKESDFVVQIKVYSDFLQKKLSLLYSDKDSRTTQDISTLAVLILPVIFCYRLRKYT